MPNAARLLDTVDGTTAGEHSANGQPAAIVTSITTERDSCCGSSLGTVAVGSGTVRINGLPAARLGDALAPHSGSGTITGGSPDVRIGG